MYQLLVEENTMLVNCVQSWQGTTIKQQRLWVLLPTAVKNPSKMSGLVPPGQSEHYWFTTVLMRR